MLKSLFFIAQVQAETQGEYGLAIGLVVAMVFLGLLVVGIPRPRAKHFVEPEDESDDKKKRKKKKR